MEINKEQFINNVRYELVDENEAKRTLGDQFFTLIDGRTGEELKDFMEEIEAEVMNDKVMNYIYRLYTDYVCNRCGF